MGLWRVLAILSLVYFGQGMLWGFALPIRAEFGLEHSAWLLLFGALPWVSKFIWGPVMDRYVTPQDARRSLLVIVLLQALCILSLLLMALLASRAEEGSLQEALFPLAVSWVICNLCMALQDVSVDGFAIDQLPEERRGLGRGLGLAATAIGTGWFSAAFLASFAAFHVKLAVLAAALLVTLLSVIFSVPWRSLASSEKRGRREYGPNSAASWR